MADVPTTFETLKKDAPSFGRPKRRKKRKKRKRKRRLVF